METQVADTKSAQSAPDETDEGAAPATASGKVLVRARMLEEFVVPAELDKNGKPKGDDLLVDSDGVEVSKREATKLIELAAEHGVSLTAEDV